MRKTLVIATFLAAGLVAANLAPTKISGQKHGIVRAIAPVPDRYIVVLSDEIGRRGLTSPEVESYARSLSNDYGGKIDVVYSSAFAGFSAEMTAEQAEAMNQDAAVRTIEEDALVFVSDTQPNAPWHLDRIDQRPMPMDSIFNYSATGAGVNVYVLDTGVRFTHQDFGGRANAVYDNINDGLNGGDCTGHGTHVAGIIGSSTYGVAKQSLIHSVRVVPCSGFGQISNLLAGIDWVTANRVNPAVANISITAPGTSPALELGLTNSIASGVTYTVAAGNNSSNACSFTPARTPNALTVGATATSDERLLMSNYGPCLDLFAPGYQVTSLSYLNDTDTRILTGTSMASPMVAGAAALYLGLNPTAGPVEVSNAIKGAATTGLITLIDGTSPNKLLFTQSTAAPTPTPGTVVTIRKLRQNTNGNTPDVQFPYSATNLAQSTFTLVDNAYYQDPAVPVSTTPTSVIVEESPVVGWRLSSIVCTETSNGGTPVSDTTVDLANGRANILAQAGEAITCTFTSEPISPSAAMVSVSGRVLTTHGQGIRNARVTLTDSNGNSIQTLTNSLGHFIFDNVEVGQNYVLITYSKGRSFAPQLLTLEDEIADLELIALE